MEETQQSSTVFRKAINKTLCFLKMIKENIKLLTQKLITKIRALDAKQRKKLILVLIGAGILFIVFWLWLVFAVFMSSSSKSKPVGLTPQLKHQAVQMQQQQIKAQGEEDYSKLLMKIEDQIQTINTNTTNKNDQEKLNQLSKQLSTVIQSNRQASQTTQDKINVLQEAQVKTQVQNASVQQQLKAIHRAVTPVRYLSARALPFQVEGISFWNGEPMVTISMLGTAGENYYKLIGVGQKYGCSGVGKRRHGCESWMVKSIDGDTHVVIFLNQRGQLVKVAV